MLDWDHKIKTRSFYRNVFKTFDVGNDGRITAEEVGKVLTALGRPLGEKQLQKMTEKFVSEEHEKLDWSNTEFLEVVSDTKVSNINLVEDFVLSAAFSTFDQDVDGYINPEEMHVVVKLFLPPKVQKDDEYIRDIISQMDLDNDGMINYEEFVEIVKAIGAPIYMRYFSPLLSTVTTCVGFLVYMMSLYVGLSVAWYWSYDE